MSPSIEQNSVSYLKSVFGCIIKRVYEGLAVEYNIILISRIEVPNLYGSPEIIRGAFL